MLTSDPGCYRKPNTQPPRRLVESVSWAGVRQPGQGPARAPWRALAVPRGGRACSWPERAGEPGAAWQQHGLLPLYVFLLATQGPPNDTFPVDTSSVQLKLQDPLLRVCFLGLQSPPRCLFMTKRAAGGQQFVYSSVRGNRPTGWSCRGVSQHSSVLCQEFLDSLPHVGHFLGHKPATRMTGPGLTPGSSQGSEPFHSQENPHLGRVLPPGLIPLSR